MMNPIPIALASLHRNAFTAGLFVVIVALAAALGVAISAQERTLREGSARAADRFDLIVAAPGSLNDLLFSVVYLDPVAVELLAPNVTQRLMAEPRADFVAPIGFGDDVDGAPVIGTISAFVEHLSGGIAEGRVFAAPEEAVVGALSPHQIGDVLHVGHGGGDADLAADALASDNEDHHHDHDHDHDDAEHDHDEHDHEDLLVVGRMQPTGTPWDRAIVVPIEYNWEAHGLGNGHAEGDTHIGPPFAPDALPGVPALVVKPTDVAAAYGLRGAYRSTDSTAFFPAEVLTQLYAVLGDATAIMGGLTLAAQALVVAAILAGIVAILDLQRQRFAVLRALGAPRRFVFATVWLYVAAIVVTGAVAGMALGWVFATLLSEYLAQTTGISMRAAIGLREVHSVGIFVLLGLVLATIPALLIYRRPVIESLR